MSSAAPLILSLRSLRKDRLVPGQGANYSLSIPALDVRLGEKILVTGPSGCGKSTLLDIIGMVLRPDEMQSFLFFPEARRWGDPVSPSPSAPHIQQGRDVAAAWAGGKTESLALWRRHVGYVLQTGGLLPFISVRENILTARRLLAPNDDPLYASLPDKLALSLGIRHLLDKYPAQISVGERQRVAIGRALAANPPLVLADEPTAALDPANAAAVLALFSRMTDELGATLILVSHAPEQMRGMGFRRLHVRLEAFVKNGVAGTQAILEDKEV